MSEVWKNSEANAWFKRNSKGLTDDYISRDLTVKLLDLYNIKSNRIIELGSANGYRVNILREKYNSDIAYAVEPSSLAIEDGKKKYPNIHFINSTCEDLEIKEKFDLVILGFFMFLLPRQNVLKCLNIIDSLVEENGILVINDFYSDSLIKRHYKHLTGEYTYKTNYSNLFTKIGTYIEIASFSYSSDTSLLTTELTIDNLAKITILKKQDNFIIKE